MSGTYDDGDGRAARLADYVMEHVLATSDGMSEGLTFWESRQPKHARYFEGRRHAVDAIKNEVMRGILAFFATDEIEAILSHCEESKKQLRGGE